MPGIKITANGLELEVPRGTTVGEILDILEETLRSDVIVEINHKFIHLKEYGQITINEGDNIEVIHLEMGG